MMKNNPFIVRSKQPTQNIGTKDKIKMFIRSFYLTNEYFTKLVAGYNSNSPLIKTLNEITDTLNYYSKLNYQYMQIIKYVWIIILFASWQIQNPTFVFVMLHLLSAITFYGYHVIPKNVLAIEDAYKTNENTYSLARKLIKPEDLKIALISDLVDASNKSINTNMKGIVSMIKKAMEEAGMNADIIATNLSDDDDDDDTENGPNNPF